MVTGRIIKISGWRQPDPKHIIFIKDHPHFGVATGNLSRIGIDLKIGNIPNTFDILTSVLVRVSLFIFSSLGKEV